jgi:hypothetical protein
MHRFLIVSLALLCACAEGQAQTAAVRLVPGSQVPRGLLAGRTVVLYPDIISPQELTEIQKAFQYTGIDAVAYFEEDKALAGYDATRALADYLVSRQVQFLVILGKANGNYHFYATAYTGSPELIARQQDAWHEEHVNLRELLLTVYRNAWLAEKKQNFLINEVPETDITINLLRGRRAELYAVDLKIDMLAVPRLTDSIQNQVLEQFFATHYPLRYKMVNEALDEKELRKQGFHYVLRVLQARGIAVRQLLGYDLSKAESAYVSVTYPNGLPQFKTLPVDVPVYKFYTKHLESGNVFLGARWDADTTWPEALRNHIKALKAELKLE